VKRDLYIPGLIALLVVGAVFLLPGIGTGIWDPWEMDRAHLAREMAGRTKLLVVEEKGAGLAESLRAGAGERFFVEEVAGKRAARVLNDRVYHAVLVHRSALADDPANGAAFIDDLVASHPGVEPVLVAATRSECDELFLDLEAGQVANAFRMLKDDALFSDDLDEAALVDRHAGAWPFQLLVPCVALDEAEDPGTLLGWLDGIQWSRLTCRAALAAKEKKGKHAGYGTFAMPPMDAWLTGLSYETFGFSETSSRMPGVVMGLLTLLVLGLGLWRLAGPRAAFLSVAVALTTPMFLGQAKNMAGEISYTLFLTSGVLSFALLIREARLRWLPGLLVSAALLFLAKGLFGLGVLWLVVAGYVAALADLRRPTLAALGILTALFGVLIALVLVPTEWTFFAHFKFMNHPFNGGPTRYFSWFDFFIRQVGFGAFPWTILLPFALGALALRLRNDDPEGLDERRVGGLVFLWFTVPFVAHSAGMTDFRHLVFPAITALGPAVALFWLQDAGEERARADGFVAVGILGVAAVVLQGLLKTREPAVNWLTVDPLMSAQAAAGAEEVSLLGTGAKALAAGVVLLAFLYHARLSEAARKVLAFFRRPTPAWITLWIIVAAFVFKTLGTLVSRFGGQTPKKALGKVAPQIIDLPNHLLRYRLDLVLIALVLAVLGVAALLRYTRAGGWGRTTLRGLGVLPPLRRIGHALNALAVVLSDVVKPSWVWLLPGVGLLTWAFLNLVLTFPFDAGSAREILVEGGFPVAAAVLAVVLVAAAAALRSHLPDRAVFYAAAAGAVLVLLTLAGRIQAATDGSHWDAPVLMILGTAAWAAALATWLLRAPRLLHGVAWGLGLWLSLSILVPLISGWNEVESILHPDAQPRLRTYLFWSSRVVRLIYVAAAGLTLNIGLARLLDRVVTPRSPLAARVLNPLAWLQTLERPAVYRVGMLILTLAFAGVFALKTLPGFARSVSQKHIIQTYLSADGRETLGENIFKHQGKTRGRDDRNFYTAPLPALASQNDLLDALALTKDKVFEVKRSSSHPGPETALLRAWSHANDEDEDGRRDHDADAGLAGQAGVDDRGAYVTDESKTWTPDRWAGHVLVDWRGKTTEILGNDATRLSLAAASRVEAGRSGRSLYRIDHPEAADHGATAMGPGRVFVIMDQQGFSESNYKFRKKKRAQLVKAGAPGAKETAPPHIPVIEGDNLSFLLAASSLAEGEENENPFARATITDEELENLEGVNRSWVDLDGKIRLEGYRISKRSYARGEKLSIDLFFRCTDAVPRSYKIFMHIDAEGSGNRINGDHWPLNRTSDPEIKECIGCWKTSHWMAGDLIVDHFETEVPLGTPSGRQNIWMGLYMPGGGKRLKVKDWDRKAVRHDGHDRFRIGHFEVH